VDNLDEGTPYCGASHHYVGDDIGVLGRLAAGRVVGRSHHCDRKGAASDHRLGIQLGIQRPSALASCALVIDERPLTPRLRASEYS